MRKSITRRRFITGSAAAGAGLALGSTALNELAGVAFAESAKAGVVAVTGGDAWQRTLAAVEAVGGISGLVTKDSSVIINANIAFKHRGSIVDPEVLLAVLSLCAEAGAAKIELVKPPKGDYWERCDRAKAMADLVDSVGISERKTEVIAIEGANALKEAHVDRRLLEADHYINVAISKHHTGCEYTGALKNTMGLCPHDPTCRFFHVGTDPDSKDWYPDLPHLAQCIADLNTVRQPELNILDAGEILTTNGPFGPGKLATPGAVVASTDMVAIDAFGVGYLGFDPAAVEMIGRSEALGIGSADLGTVGVRKIELA